MTSMLRSMHQETMLKNDLLCDNRYQITAREMIDILNQTPLTDSMTGILEPHHDDNQKC